MDCTIISQFMNSVTQMKTHWDRQKFNLGKFNRIPVKEVLIGKKWIKRADYMHQIRNDIDVFSTHSKANKWFKTQEVKI